MSKFTQTHVFTSEAVSEGHPDKVCDQISDAILDACLAEDPESHVACETAAGHNLVVNLGEITCAGHHLVNYEAIAREVVKDIGYDDPSEGFSYDTFKYISAIHGQSPDINQGVSRGGDDIQGAGGLDVKSLCKGFNKEIEILKKTKHSQGNCNANGNK